MENKTKPMVARPRLYAVYFQRLAEIAREMGYNLLVNGSMNRDLDLVAVPWIDKPKPEMELIQAFDMYLSCGYMTDPEHYMYKVLPGGRNAYVCRHSRNVK